ncbi:MAG: VanW family protein [Eubacteriales bacterium]|nr:VanW family protein [Eubacteriales bacterium]
MGRRVERIREEKKKLKLKAKIGIGCAIALGVAYISSCAFVPKDTILKGVVMNGVEVGEMKKEDAAKKLAEQFEKDYEKAALKVKVIDKEYEVPVYKALKFDEKQAAEDAYAFGHSNYFARSAQWLWGMIAKVNIPHYPELVRGGELGVSVMESGISSVNTTSQTSYTLEGEDLQITMGKTGHSVDMKELNKALCAAVDTNDYDTVIEAPLKEGKVAAFDVDALYEKLYAKKREATLDPKNKYKMVKSITGVDFDKEGARTSINSAKEGDVIHVPVTIDEPKISTADLKKHLFEAVLGECTTSVSGSYERLSNVNLASSTINDIILMPGEEFSYNDRVGERTAKRGYKAAPAYNNGESVLELGGGVCQVSSTLYKAVVLSNLEIKEHHNHTYESAYIDLGMDATVSWDGPDFKFKNNMDYPIKILMNYKGDSLTCKVKGAKLTSNTVKFTNEVLKVIPFGTKKQKDKTLAVGKKKVVSHGHNGYIVQTYRKIVDKNGKVISSEKEDYNVYSKKDEVVAVGVKKVAKKAKDSTAASTQKGSSTTPTTNTASNSKPAH